MHHHTSQSSSVKPFVYREQVFDYTQSLLANCTELTATFGENIATRSTVDGEGKNETAINSTLESSTTTVGPIECDEIYDSVLCWPRVIAGTVAKVSCRQAFRAMGLPDPENSLDAVVTIDSQVIHFRDSYATRVCGTNGTWLYGNWTNYTQCLPFIDDSTDSPGPSTVASIVGFILFFCSTISLAFLSISMYIFFHFKTLKCTRLRVHRNFFAALMLHSASLIVISGPAVLGDYFPLRYIEYNWLCRLVLAIKVYSLMASINWMFVEGLLLHTKLSGVFSEGPPFPCYYAIGWGVPAAIVVFWSSLMSMTLESACWNGYSKSPYIWMLTVPMFCALIANAVFLVNIIRILLLKIKNTVSNEMRKALKATAFLFPLLGMNQLIFCFNPRDEDQFEDAYMLINALLQSSQGIIVAILYCFTNTQVKTTIKAAYCRRIMLRDVNSLRINNQHTTNINLRNSPNNQHNNNNSSIPQCNTDNTNINCNSNVTMKDSDNDQLNNITVDTNDSTLINHSQFDCLKPHSQSRKHKSSPPLCKKLIETHKSPMSRDTIEEETTIDSNSSLTSSKSFDVITHHHSNHNHFDNHHHHQHHRHYQDQLGNSNRDPTSATSLV